MLRSGAVASLLVVLVCASSAAAAPGLRLRRVAVTPPVGLLGVEEKPTITLKPQRDLPSGSYYYAVAVLVHYAGRGRDLSAPPCAISSDMSLTQYGRPQRGKSLQLTLLPTSDSQGRWCADGIYEGAVYAVPHPPPCSRYYPCYGRGSGCGQPEGVCGIVLIRPYSYPGGLPKPIDRKSRIVGHFKLHFGSTAGTESGIEPEVAKQLLSIAEREALRRGGDAHPYDIEAVSTTQESVARLEGGSAGPSFAADPVYYVALRGNFGCGGCSRPPGVHSTIRGKVITLTITAPGLIAEGFGLSLQYPELSRAGDPVRLG